MENRNPGLIRRRYFLLSIILIVIVLASFVLINTIGSDSNKNELKILIHLIFSSYLNI